MSREATDDDPEVRQFWANHLPIMMSVKGDYAYVALRFVKRRCRSVVWGWGPEFEEASVCAKTFAEFLGNLTEALHNGTDSGLIASFL